MSPVIGPGDILLILLSCVHIAHLIRRDAEERAILLWGSYREYLPHHRRIYLYERSYKTERMLIVCSFSEKEQAWKLPEG
ncbi:MAG: alpha-glucosidase C-terminal domain-containing protein, partial [Lachnospiraceae bacterium]|nr:alpha-glucosidase C-terminal domain-containing protein [Lachnospiraceae bacterium]